MSDSKYGVDIGIRRADDLDKLCIEVISNGPGSSVLDLGCGEGGQSARLARVGARVTGVDIEDYSNEFEQLKLENSLSDDSLLFIQGDISNLKDLLTDNQYDYCSVQRVLHYLTYKDASLLLAYLKSIVKKELFISVTGTETEIGNSYTARETDIKDRFAILEPDGQETFSIREPVCLYSEREFRSLLQESGWEVIKLWTSAFGNHKAICI